MQNKIVGALLVVLFILSALVEGAYANKSASKLPVAAQQLINSVQKVVAMVAPISKPDKIAKKEVEDLEYTPSHMLESTLQLRVIDFDKK